MTNTHREIAKPGLDNNQYQQLFAAIEQGLPLVAEPYLEIAKQVDMSEQQVLDTLTTWQENGLIRRFGLVVRHRKLGYDANAMVVFNIPDQQVDGVAEQLAKESVVSLCYRRPRVLPHWPYNLFCMIHGKNRQQVLAQLDTIRQRHNLQLIEQNVLFSTTAYKQRGAKYSANMSATATEPTVRNVSG